MVSKEREKFSISEGKKNLIKISFSAFFSKGVMKMLESPAGWDGFFATLPLLLMGNG
jgi:hypothetical protein